MPWRDALRDPEFQKTVLAWLLAVLRWSIPLINHFRLARVEKKLDGVLKDPTKVVATKSKHRQSLSHAKAGS